MNNFEDVWIGVCNYQAQGLNHRSRGQCPTAVEISQEDRRPAPEERHLCSSESKRTPKLRRSDIDSNMPPLRGWWCCGPVRFYKDSAPTELALSGPHQNYFLISTVVGQRSRKVTTQNKFRPAGQTRLHAGAGWAFAFLGPFSKSVTLDYDGCSSFRLALLPSGGFAILPLDSFLSGLSVKKNNVERSPLCQSKN